VHEVAGHSTICPQLFTTDTPHLLLHAVALFGTQQAPLAVQICDGGQLAVPLIPQLTV
jgi:hypothetical protein